MRIALDAMGGDYAPEPIITGALQAIEADPELHVVLVGDQERIKPILADQANLQRIELHHCSEAVGMDESPVEALRRKPDNSIGKCWELLANRRVDAIVSAGNTGAMVAGGLRLRLFLKNVRRPGIGAILPTLRGPCVMLDVGANVKPKPEHLFQYGVMGSIFARHILQHAKPTIGLMNVGAEAKKGHGLAQETHALFDASPLKPQFIGNVEGRDIFNGDCDVVVTDGFVGNVALKICEGSFAFAVKMIANQLEKDLDAERDIGLGALRKLVYKYDYNQTGGAPLLGIDGICIICHGSSRDRAIKNALAMAATYARVKLNALIVDELEADLQAIQGT